MPTDTLYGLVAKASDPNAIKRIYKIKGRKRGKPFITLISAISDLKKFNIKPTSPELVFLEKVWPGPVSVILSNQAFRLPKLPSLLKILRQTGPLVAPSANREGEKPSATIQEARKYFDSQVDFYLPGGKLGNKPSTLVTIKGGKVKVLREGRIKIRN